MFHRKFVVRCITETGESELLIGIANDFYGWGSIARLENIEGLDMME
jgi:hypothetical protein